MLGYFTILTNLLVAATFLSVAAGRPPSPRWFGGVLLAIALVGVIYAALLAGLRELTGGSIVASAPSSSSGLTRGSMPERWQGAPAVQDKVVLQRRLASSQFRHGFQGLRDLRSLRPGMTKRGLTDTFSHKGRRKSVDKSAPRLFPTR